MNTRLRRSPVKVVRDAQRRSPGPTPGRPRGIKLAAGTVARGILGGGGAAVRSVRSRGEGGRGRRRRGAGGGTQGTGDAL